jgi:hypothetical protein
MFDIGNVFGSIAKAVLPSLISAEFPFTALVPGLNNMIANVAGDMLSAGIDSMLKQLGSPQFMISDVLNVIKQATQNQQQPCDPSTQDEAQGQFGDQITSLVSDAINELLGKLRAELGCHGGKGGHGGTGGTGGTGGSGGPVGIRELAAALGALEEQEAAKVKKLVDDAKKALDDPNQAGKGGQQSGGQFSAMEAVKAEAQVQSTLSSMVSEVLKNFGQALQSAGRD